MHLSPQKGEGDICSVQIPGRRRWRDSLYIPYFLNQLVEVFQTCMDISVGQAKGLNKFL